MMTKINIFIKTPWGETTSTTVPSRLGYDELVHSIDRRCDEVLLKLHDSGFFDTRQNDELVTNDSCITSKMDSYLVHEGRVMERKSNSSDECDSMIRLEHNTTISVQLRLLGGIDRQNRVGSKFGGGGVSSSQNAERERKDRLKRLALESIDLAKDPYLMRNHLGTYECKLCLTLHPNEANYLAHTQGKKHQQGLARRAYLEKKREEKEATLQPVSAPVSSLKKAKVQKIRIGRPAYQVSKSRDPDTNQRALIFELSFPEIDMNIQPRHRFMSAFEQQVDTPPDRRYQYLLIAADPYETVGFKIPNEPLDKEEGKFVTHWDIDTKRFTLTLYYADNDDDEEEKKDGKPAAK